MTSPGEDVNEAWATIRAEGQGLVWVGVLQPGDVLVHPNRTLLQSVIVEWIHRMPKWHPQCFCCQHKWCSFKDKAPAAYVLCHAAGIANPTQILCSGVCRRCVDRPAHINRTIRKQFPFTQEISMPVVGPETIQ